MDEPLLVTFMLHVIQVAYFWVHPYHKTPMSLTISLPSCTSGIIDFCLQISLHAYISL